jgi:toxin ParE1/3/4
MPHRVIFSPEALTQLEALFDHIAAAAGSNIARAFTGAIVEYCEGFDVFPLRGMRRDDLLPSLRTIGFRRRVTIAFMVEDDAVTIIGIFYGGQDYESDLHDQEEP